jgi:hypothetical protein
MEGREGKFGRRVGKQSKDEELERRVGKESREGEYGRVEKESRDGG